MARQVTSEEVTRAARAASRAHTAHKKATEAHFEAREAGVTGSQLASLAEKRARAKADLEAKTTAHKALVEKQTRESSGLAVARLVPEKPIPNVPSNTRDETVNVGSPITEGTAVSNPCPTCRKEAVPARMVSVKNGPRSSKTTAVCRDCATLGSDIKTIGAAHQERQERIASQPKPETSNVTEAQMRGLLGSEADLSVRTASRTPHDLRGVLPAGLPSGVGAMAVGLDAGSVPRTQADVRGLGATPTAVQQLADEAIGHAQARSAEDMKSAEYAQHHAAYQEAHARLSRVAPAVAELVHGISRVHDSMMGMVRRHQRDPSSATPERLAQIQSHKKNIRQMTSQIGRTISTAAGAMGVESKGLRSADELSKMVGDTSALVTGGRVIEGSVPRRERTDLPERPIREAKQPPRQPR